MGRICPRSQLERWRSGPGHLRHPNELGHQSSRRIRVRDDKVVSRLEKRTLWGHGLAESDTDRHRSPADRPPLHVLASTQGLVVSDQQRPALQRCPPDDAIRINDCPDVIREARRILVQRLRVPESTAKEFEIVSRSSMSVSGTSEKSSLRQHRHARRIPIAAPEPSMDLTVRANAQPPIADAHDVGQESTRHVLRVVER